MFAISQPKWKRKFESLIKKYDNYCLDSDSFINYILELWKFKCFNNVTALILIKHLDNINSVVILANQFLIFSS